MKHKFTLLSTASKDLVMFIEYIDLYGRDKWGGAKPQMQTRKIKLEDKWRPIGNQLLT